MIARVGPVGRQRAHHRRERHRQGRRRRRRCTPRRRARTRPMVTVNAGGLSEGVFESELFGHVKGAFTDAKTDRVGRFELADGGTLFLDEIANVPPAAAGQAAARARDRRVRARRLVADAPGERAHHLRDQRRHLRRGRGRAASARTCCSASTRSRSTLPPLRERREDIPLLAAHFLRIHASTTASALTGFEPPALQALLEHTWPGNVRELDHAVERGVLMAQGQPIRLADLSLQAGARGAGAPRGDEPRGRRGVPRSRRRWRATTATSATRRARSA